MLNASTKLDPLLDGVEIKEQYRVKSNINTGHSSFEPLADEESRKKMA